jgi:GAF domain-containing protein
MAHGRSESARTKKLIELSRRLAATGDLQSILSTVIDALRDLLDADRATVFEFDPKTNELFTQVAHGIGDADDAPSVIRIPMGAGIAGARGQLHAHGCAQMSRTAKERRWQRCRRAGAGKHSYVVVRPTSGRDHLADDRRITPTQHGEIRDQHRTAGVQQTVSRDRNSRRGIR